MLTFHTMPKKNVHFLPEARFYVNSAAQNAHFYSKILWSQNLEPFLRPAAACFEGRKEKPQKVTSAIEFSCFEGKVFCHFHFGHL